MNISKFPSDNELFPYMGSGNYLYNDYIEEAEHLRYAAKIPEDRINNRDDYGVFLRKLIKQNHELYVKMEYWLVKRLLQGESIDSFPPDTYEFKTFSVKKTTTTTTYDPYYDTEEESVRKEQDNLSIGVEYFYGINDSMNRLEKGESSDGTYIYDLMKPIYQVLERDSLFLAAKGLLSPIFLVIVSILLFFGSKYLSDTVKYTLPIINILIVLVGFGAALVTIGGGIWLIARIFYFFQVLMSLLSKPRLRKKAAKNVLKVHCILRYYRLWEKNCGKRCAGVAMIDKYLNQYLDEFGD